MSTSARTAVREADSAYAWWRLVATLGLMTVGSSAMYVVAVVLPAVQAEFGVGRSQASIPYTLLMIGFGFGGILMGRLADRHGVTVPLFIGAAGLGLGFLAAAWAPNIWLFALAHGIGLGLFGCSATFAPLVADTSLWFVRRRGIAVGICASGNYLAGAVWHGTATRLSDIYIQLFCDDSKSAEIALIDHHVDYEPRTVTGFHGESVEALSLGSKCAELNEMIGVHLMIYDLDDLRGAMKPDAKGRTPRGDVTAVRRLLEETAP